MSEYNTMDEKLKELLQDMNNIANVQPGQKISRDSKEYHSSNFVHAVLRTCRGDSRTKTVKFIDDTIYKCSRMLDDYKNSKFHEDILESLIRMRRGIKNLVITYGKDPDTTSKLSVAIMQINHWLPEGVLENIGK